MPQSLKSESWIFISIFYKSLLLVSFSFIHGNRMTEESQLCASSRS